MSTKYRPLQDKAKKIVQTAIQGPILPMVSVIIPMYNSERYIESCVKSALNQTLKNIEIICVDDCSTDNTYNIVAELAKQDSRIRLAKLEKNSGGASEPRNFGMRISRGKYIGFLDSDDLYTKTAMEELVTIAEKFNADVIHTEQVYFPKNGVIDVDDKTEFTTFSKEKGGFCTEPTLETDDLVKRLQMYYKERFFGWIHNKLFKRDYLMQNDIKFPDIKTSEDIVFYFSVVCTAKRFVRVPNIIYIYRRNPNSITRQVVKVEKAFHTLTEMMVKGTKIMDDVMAKYPVCVNNPSLRQLPLDYIIQKHLIWTLRFYEKYTPAQLDYFLRKEFEPYCKEYAPFFSYLYSATHMYMRRIMEKDKRIHELEEENKKFKQQLGI